MTRTLLITVCCCLTACCAQQPVVLLDPARGGAESGARIADRLPEKQVTLDMAGRLASLLRARGFNVVLTRETDVDISSDTRAAMANNLRPIACILLHATPSGSGVHLYTSALRQQTPAAGTPVRWDEAQAAFVERSRALETDLKAALLHSKITASSGQTWMRPLDNMQCPAVAIEVAPEKDGTGAEDSTYQAQISNALANTLLPWRSKVGGMAPPEPQPAPAPSAVKPLATATQPSVTPPGSSPGAKSAVPAATRKLPVTAAPPDRAQP